MNQDEKREVVERLVVQIKEAKAMIVTDYRGLTVPQTAEVRRALREAGHRSTWPRTRSPGSPQSRPSGRR